MACAVSIIIPVFNGEKYIKECLDSVMAQTLRQIEVVIVDDGSTDQTPEILTEYAAAYPEKVKVITKSNGGQGSARNLALLHCSGEYVGYVDADDSISAEMFERMYQTAKSGEYDLVTCDWNIVEGRKKKINIFGEYATPKDMYKGVNVVPWNKLIKRETLLHSGVQFPEGYIYEDTAWFIELLAFIKTAAHIPRPFINHRVWSGSTMGAKQNARAAQIFPVMNHIVEFYKNKGIFEEYKIYVEYFYVKVLLCSSLQRIAKVGDRKLRKQLSARTLSEIKTNFPQYKKNPCLKGVIGQYIKSVNKLTIKFYLLLFKYI